jgi:hypothetical protein
MIKNLGILAICLVAASAAHAQVTQLGGGCTGITMSFPTPPIQNCLTTITVSGLAPLQSGMLLADADNGATLPFGACTLHTANNPIAIASIFADPMGNWSFFVVMPPGVVGVSFRLQAVLVQSGGPVAGFLTLSDAVRVQIMNDAADLDNVFVDASNTNTCPAPNGSIVSPFLTIAAGIAAVNDGGNVHVAPGVYAERIEVFGKNANIVGSFDPTTTPLAQHTIVRPTGSLSGPSAICQLGFDNTDGTDKDKTVTLTNLVIDGANVDVNCNQNFGVRFSNASGGLTNCIIENIGLDSYGCQGGIAVRGLGAVSQPQTLSFTNSIFRRWDKQAFSLRGHCTATWTGCSIEGMGLAAPNQNSQNGIFFRDAVAGTFNGCTFKDIGPSGGPARLIATDGSYGYCAGVFNNVAPFVWDGHSYGNYERAKSEIVLVNNVFQNCQGIWIDLDMYDGFGTPATWKKNDEIIANNPGLAQNGGWISWGPTAESADLTGNMSVLGSHLNAGPYNQDSMLQYVLDNYTAFGFPFTGFTEDSIVLGPGTYEDDAFTIATTSVPSPFAVRSYQGGANPVTTFPRGAEATIKRTGISYPQGFYVMADAVTLEGLRFEGMVDGVFFQATRSGHQVLRNVFENNVFGIYLNASGASPSMVAENLFLTNNVSGAASGNGIYADQGTHDVSIQDNSFAGNTNASIVLDAFGTPNSDITITGNTVSQDGSFVAIFQTNGLTVSNNTVTGTPGSAIFLGGNVTNAVIDGNQLSALGSRGIRVADVVGTPNGTVTVQNNVINVANPTANRPGIQLASVGGTNLVHQNSVTWTGAINGTGEVNGIEITGGVTGVFAVTANTLQGGSIGGMAGSGSAGIRVNGLGATSLVDVTTGNSVTGFDHAVRAGNLPAPLAMSITFNSFCGNLAATDAGIRYDAAALPFILQAEFNWYGAASGPFNASTNPGGTGDGVSDFVDYAPFLLTGPTCP